MSTRGRPTLYAPWMLGAVQQLAAEGLGDETIAQRIGVGFRTFCKWKQTNPNIANAIATGRSPLRYTPIAAALREKYMRNGNGRHEEPRKNNQLTGKSRILLYTYMKDNAFLEPHPEGQSETWRYRDEMTDSRVADGYTAEYNVLCTKNNVRSVREEMWGKLAYDMDDTGKAIGAAGMWIYIKALEARIAHLETEWGVKRP